MSDDEILAIWRSVSGPNAQLTGPLIRFANYVGARDMLGKLPPEMHVTAESNRRDVAYVDGFNDCLCEVRAALSVPPPPPQEPALKLSDAIALCQQWIDAYPVQVFPPDGESKDCHAAAMGRHMAKCLIEDFTKFARLSAQEEPKP